MLFGRNLSMFSLPLEILACILGSSWVCQDVYSIMYLILNYLNVILNDILLNIEVHVRLPPYWPKTDEFDRRACPTNKSRV